MKNRLFLSLAALLVLLAMTTPAWADPCEPITDPLCDPSAHLQTDTGTPLYTWTSADPTHMFGFTFTANGDYFFRNETGVNMTDLHLVLTNPQGNANSYNCGGTPDAFSMTCNFNEATFTWTWDGGAIPNNITFSLQLNGFNSGPPPSTAVAEQFTLTPSFGDGDQHDGSVPEPASLLLLGSGLAGLAGMVRRRRARS